MKYRAVEGDVLDAICARFYGVGKFDIGEIYAANQGLADLGVILPKGTIVILPEKTGVRTANKPRIRLWS